MSAKSGTGPFVTFVDEALSATGKTHTYRVLSTAGSSLGVVKWYGAWRCYAFFPARDTLYEQKCLRSIADFCEARTAEKRAASTERSHQ